MSIASLPVPTMMNHPFYSQMDKRMRMDPSASLHHHSGGDLVLNLDNVVDHSQQLLMSPAVNRAAHRKELPIELDGTESKTDELTASTTTSLATAPSRSAATSFDPTTFATDQTPSASATAQVSAPQAQAPAPPTFVYPTTTAASAPSAPSAPQLSATVYPHFYHPYQRMQPHPSQSPAMSMMTASPATSVLVTPPSSTSSYVQQLPMNYSPSAISPALVSPVTALSNQLSDLSQQTSMPWGYAPYHQHQHQHQQQQQRHQQAQGAMALALAATGGGSGGGPSHMGGFAVPANPSFRQQHALKTMIPNRETHSGLDSPDKDFDDLVEMDDADSSAGLRFTANENDRIVLSVKREDIRQARIDSEKRRRDDLRQGFERLRDALPPSNQRTSKSAILDRAVAHIQTLESAHHYMNEQVESLLIQNEELRNMNNKLVAAMANSPQSGGSDGSPTLLN